MTPGKRPAAGCPVAAQADSFQSLSDNDPESQQDANRTEDVRWPGSGFLSDERTDVRWQHPRQSLRRLQWDSDDLGVVVLHRAGDAIDGKTGRAADPDVKGHDRSGRAAGG